MGGAQAIAALAYGTETVPRVDRIVGPGNIYVAAAKKLIAGETGYRLCRRADGNRDYRRGRKCALDRRRHARAGRARRGCLGDSADHFANSRGIGRARKSSGSSRRSRRRESPAPSIESNGAIVIVKSMDQAVEFSNALAPGASRAARCGSCCRRSEMRARFFWGRRARKPRAITLPVPNHVLPTSGAARLRGGLSSADFVKVISVQELSRERWRIDARHHHAGARGRVGGARAIRGGARWLMRCTL